MESPDGRQLYFTLPGRPGLWRRVLPGKSEAIEPESVIPDLMPQDRWNWRLISKGDKVQRIAWVMRIQGSAFLMFFDPVAKESSFFSELPGMAGPGLAISPAGDEIVYARTENMAADLMLLEGVFASP